MLKNAKELPSQRTTTRPKTSIQARPKEGQQITGVWQNGGRSAKLNIWNSIWHLCKTEHLCF